MGRFKIQAPAKINLSLDILSKRDDGYHNIESIMHPINLCDIITIEEIEEDLIISCNNESIPIGHENTVYKAAEIILRETGLKRGLHINIENNIPIGAGLGGGSADAAATILGINELFSLGLTIEEMSKLGSWVGSDVPFCVMRRTALVRGKGEEVIPIEASIDPWFVLIIPDFSIYTKDAYKAFDEIKIMDKRLPKVDEMLKVISCGDCKGLCKELYNVMEIPVFQRFPVLKEIKERLIAKGALGALMSGSGSTIFGIAESEKAAKDIADKAKASFVSLPIKDVITVSTFNYKAL